MAISEEMWELLLKFDREIVRPQLEAIQTRMDERFDAVFKRPEFTDFVDDVYRRFERLESEYVSLNAAVKRLEQQIPAIERRLAALEKAITELPRKLEIDALRARVDELERDIVDVKKRVAALGTHQ